MRITRYTKNWLVSWLKLSQKKKKNNKFFFNKKIFNFYCAARNTYVVHARTTQYLFGFILDEYWHLYFLMGFGFGLVPLHPFGFAVGSRLGFFFFLIGILGRASYE